MDLFTILSAIVAILASAVAASSIPFISRLVRGNEKKFNDSVAALESITASKAGSLSERKKLEIVKSSPKIFFYLDESQVNYLYPQIAGEIRPKGIQIKQSKGSSAGTVADVKLIKGALGGRVDNEKVVTYEIADSLATKYIFVEQFLIENNKVTFALEDFEDDLQTGNEIEKALDIIKTSGVKIPEDIEQKLNTNKKHSSAMESLAKLQKAEGFVALKCEFVSSNMGEISYKRLYYNHPLSQYLKEDEGRASIEIICLPKFMTPIGENAFEVYKHSTVICLGKIVNWDKSSKTLKISPVAIY